MIYFVLILLCAIVPAIEVYFWRNQLIGMSSKRTSYRSMYNQLMYRRKETWFLAMETVGIILISAVIASVAYKAQVFNTSQDTETINGSVTSKKIEKQDCKYPGWYDYSDDFCTNENTRSVVDHYRTVCDADGKNCRSEAVYKTQYSYDYPWEQKFFVYSNIDDYVIEREDSQGAKTPKRFDIVNVGDPVSKTHSYNNRLLLAGKNILNPQNTAYDEAALAALPTYPGVIFDYYRLNRMISIGLPIDNTEGWNRRISDANSIIGPAKQANLIVIATDSTKYTRDLRNGIYKKWNGGKKNDVIVILGIKNNVVDFVDGITFLNNKGNEYMISEFGNLLEKPFAISLIDDIQSIVMRKFDRTAMESVKYLEDDYQPPFSVILYSIITGIVLNIILILIKRNVEY